MAVSMGLETVIDVSRRGAGGREKPIEAPRSVSSGLETAIDMSMSSPEGPEVSAIQARPDGQAPRRRGIEEGRPGGGRARAAVAQA
jgi:hypothetical protein